MVPIQTDFVILVSLGYVFFLVTFGSGPSLKYYSDTIEYRGIQVLVAIFKLDKTAAKLESQMVSGKLAQL